MTPRLNHPRARPPWMAMSSSHHPETLDPEVILLMKTMLPENPSRTDFARISIPVSAMIPSPHSRSNYRLPTLVTNHPLPLRLEKRSKNAPRRQLAMPNNPRALHVQTAMPASPRRQSCLPISEITQVMLSYSRPRARVRNGEAQLCLIWEITSKEMTR